VGEGGWGSSVELAARHASFGGGDFFFAEGFGFEEFLL